MAKHRVHSPPFWITHSQTLESPKSPSIVLQPKQEMTAVNWHWNLETTPGDSGHFVSLFSLIISCVILISLCAASQVAWASAPRWRFGGKKLWYPWVLLSLRCAARGCVAKCAWRRRTRSKKWPSLVFHWKESRLMIPGHRWASALSFNSRAATAAAGVILSLTTCQDSQHHCLCAGVCAHTHARYSTKQVHILLSNPEFWQWTENCFVLGFFWGGGHLKGSLCLTDSESDKCCLCARKDS